MGQIFKLGKYYIGDLCYVLSEEHWSQLLDKTDCFADEIPQEFKGKTIFIAGHTYGDGTYEDNAGRKYLVDSGSIGIAPVGVLDNKINGGHIVEFGKAFEVGVKDGAFYCGTIKIQIRDRDNNEESIEESMMEDTEKSHIYENVSHPVAQIIIGASNYETGKESPFFIGLEKSLLSILLYYCSNTEKELTISGLLVEINTLLRKIDNIEDFHGLFMDVSDESLKSVYTKSSFFADYTDYTKKSAGMTREKAKKENGWRLNGFNTALGSLKYRLRKNNIEDMMRGEKK